MELLLDIFAYVVLPVFLIAAGMALQYFFGSLVQKKANQAKAEYEKLRDDLLSEYEKATNLIKAAQQKAEDIKKVL